MKETIRGMMNDDGEIIVHSKACLAHAIICAVENMRDIEGMTDYRFMLMATNHTIVWAMSYLENGDVNCLCQRGQHRKGSDSDHFTELEIGEHDFIHCRYCNIDNWGKESK